MPPIDVMDLVLAALILTPLQWLVPARRGQKVLRQGIVTDVCHVFFSGLIIKFSIVASLVPVFLAAKALPISALRDLAASQPLLLQFLAALLIADLGYYAAHRLFHTAPALWRFHAIHHSIEELDWVAAHRVHPVDQVLTQFISLAPLLVIGFSTDALLLFGAVYKWQSLLKHANVKSDFGALRWLFASPAFHHWHHANEAAAIDKNFAGQLPFIDLLFGTAHMPAGEMPRRYGTDSPVPMDYVGQLLQPFRSAADAPASSVEAALKAQG